jgi:hypothetical protein
MTGIIRQSCKRAGITLMVFAIWCNCSCTRGYVLEFYNNTGKDATIITTDMAGVESRFPVKDAGVVRTPLTHVLIVMTGEQRRFYRMQPAPPTFEKNRKSMLRVLKFQIEADGTIYILQPESRGPVTAFPDQPPGYPLKPASSRNAVSYAKP